MNKMIFIDKHYLLPQNIDQKLAIQLCHFRILNLIQKWQRALL